MEVVLNVKEARIDVCWKAVCGGTDLMILIVAAGDALGVMVKW